MKKENFCVGLTACECLVPGPTVISPVGPLGRGLEGLSQAHTQRLRGHFVCNFSPGGAFADRPDTHSPGPISCLDFAGGSSWPPCCHLAWTRQFRGCSQNDLSKTFRLGLTPIQKLNERSHYIQNRNETPYHWGPSALISTTALFPSLNRKALLLLLKHKGFLPTSGPLHLLGPRPGTLFPSSMNSLLTSALLRKIVPHPSLCSALSPASTSLRGCVSLP